MALKQQKNRVFPHSYPLKILRPATKMDILTKTTRAALLARVELANHRLRFGV